ncbi:tetratricopeptide (TPR) repeat protein [Kibdelosporangium banguiense]|uniref:Tetratricopeptide (TPR) repeat protein n=1 Tax=Kibdelosporangium banguiense TaxID=1365924 RepID=A0ABS4TJP9_9PSEU|nr:tetratricopeptide repeat protein [Kibdelosporangium banguiense]MBP2324648.1 tetratricopeptide (TPR) repeat protein [Kibdelosporangium banguiense]
MTEPSDKVQRAFQLFSEAADMPTGMAKHEALERAARAADASGDRHLPAICRLALIESCYYLNRYDLILAPIAWCRTAEQRDPSVFSKGNMRSLNWAHKWVPVGLRRDPRFTLAQIESVLDELEARYKRLGFSLQPVWGQRALTATHIGDFALADEHFARFIATERDDMSDCAGCVVEEQVEHLVLRGRYEEALRHAEPALAGKFTCSTQPQGVLTALLPALTALGEVERAKNAHLTAYRRSREQASQGYVGLHLEFCAVTGNIPRGMELLRRHLDQVHHATSPIGTMNFAASAALLLSRLDAGNTELVVPLPNGGAETVTAERLRERLESTALTWAEKFDARNGTSRQTERIQSILDAPDTVRVPLAVPNPVASVPAEPVTADPVELAYQAHLAYEENDFLTGYRLLKSLPADLDPLLPAKLAARLAARRVVVFNPPNVLDELALAVQRLVEVGDLDQAARFHARLGMLRTEAGDLEAGIRTVEQALVSAEAHSSSSGRILVRLILCELLDHRHEHDRGSRLLAESLRLAEETDSDRVPSVLLESADHEARQGNLDTADRLMAEVLAIPGLRPGDKFHGLRARAAIAEVRGDVELSLAASAELVEFVRKYPGPWLPDVLLHRASLLENIDRTGDHLRELVDTVAVCRTEGTPAETAHACYVLSSGYLAHGRLVEAAEALEEALRLLPDGDDEATLRTRFRLGSVCAELGEHTEARRHFQAMADLVSEAPSVSQAMVWAGLGATSHQLNEPLEAERCHRRSAELWQEADLPVEACRAWIKTAAVIADHNPSTAMEALTRATAQIPDSDLADQLTAEVLELRGYTLARQQRYEEALADNIRAAKIVETLGEPDWQVFLMVRAARVHIAMQAPATAEQLARDAVPLLSDDTPASITARVLDVLSRALQAQSKPVSQDQTARALTARLRA